MISEDTDALQKLEIWGVELKEPRRAAFFRCLRAGIFEKFLSGQQLLDLFVSPVANETRPILPHASGVALESAGQSLGFGDGSQDSVFAYLALDGIDDYRGALREWFRVLRIGGYLVIVASRRSDGATRPDAQGQRRSELEQLWTPAALVRAIEEAFDPTAYRLRFLQEDEADAAGPSHGDAGRTDAVEVTCVVEKQSIPAWAAEIFAPPKPQVVRAFRLEPPPSFEQAESVKTIQFDSPKSQNVLVMKLDPRGDLSLARPAFEVLRRDLPNSRLTLICSCKSQQQAEGLGLFDEVLALDYFTGRGSQITPGLASRSATAASLEALLGDRRFDLAIDLRLERDTRHLITEVKADLRAAFGDPGTLDEFDITVPLPSANPRTGPENRFLPATIFFPFVGEHRDNMIDVAAGSSHVPNSPLIYGPYRELPAGRYRLKFVLEGGSQSRPLVVDVCADHGRTLYAMGDMRPPASGTTRSIFFELPKITRLVEFRILSDESGTYPALRFFGCALRREAACVGAEQTQAMCILTALAVARSRQPHRVFDLA